MASYISVPRDLSKVKTKVFMNLTKRQILCFGAGALIGVPVFFLLKSSGNLSLAALGMMAVMLPLFFLAMYEKDGQPLEVVAKHFYEAKFKRPKTRPYKTKNYYALLVQQADVEMEVNRIVQNTLYHKDFTEIDGGQIDNPEISMNAARDQILSDYGFGGRTMTRIDYDELCDRAEEAEISRRESVLGKLSDLSSRTDTPVKAAKAKEAER